MAPQTQGGATVKDTARATSISGAGVTMPPVPTKEEVNLKLVELSSAASARSLLNDKIITVERDGSISFNAVAKDANSKIQFSYSTKDNEATPLTELEVGNKISTKGVELESTSHSSIKGGRNIYLTLDNEIEKFRIDIDGKTYIINQQEIDEISKGGVKTAASVATLNSNAPSPVEQAKAIPTTPIKSAKYPGLDNLRVSPNGEVQFSITTRANDMLIHYSRYDGSCSCSGYDAIFREGGPYNIKLMGAFHQDRTFALNINHLDSSTVKVDYTLHNHVKHASVRLGGTTYQINTDEMRKHINEEVVKAQAAAVASAASKAAGPLLSTGASSGTNSAKSASDSTPTPLLASLPKEPLRSPTSAEVERASKAQQVFDSNRDSTVAAAVGASALRPKSEPRIVQKEKTVPAEKEGKASEFKQKTKGEVVQEAKAKIEELKKTPPATLEEQSKATKELRANQQKAFNALDAEAKELRDRMRKSGSPESAEFKSAQEQLNKNRAQRAELVTERIKLNQELSNSPSADPAVKRAAELELCKLKADGSRAFRVLLDQAPDATAKTEVEAQQRSFLDQVEKISPTKGQRVAEFFKSKFQGLVDWVAKGDTFSKFSEGAKSFADGTLSRIPRTSANKARNAIIALEEAKALNATVPVEEKSGADGSKTEVDATKTERVVLNADEIRTKFASDLAEANKLASANKDKISAAEAELVQAQEKLNKLRTESPADTKGILEAEKAVNDKIIAKAQVELPGIKASLEHLELSAQLARADSFYESTQSTPNQEAIKASQEALGSYESRIEVLKAQDHLAENSKFLAEQKLKLANIKEKASVLENPPEGAAEVDGAKEKLEALKNQITDLESEIGGSEKQCIEDLKRFEQAKAKAFEHLINNDPAVLEATKAAEKAKAGYQVSLHDGSQTVKESLEVKVAEANLEIAKLDARINHTLEEAGKTELSNKRAEVVSKLLKDVNTQIDSRKGETGATDTEKKELEKFRKELESKFAEDAKEKPIELSPIDRLIKNTEYTGKKVQEAEKALEVARDALVSKGKYASGVEWAEVNLREQQLEIAKINEIIANNLNDIELVRKLEVRARDVLRELSNELGERVAKCKPLFKSASNNPLNSLGEKYVEATRDRARNYKERVVRGIPSSEESASIDAAKKTLAKAESDFGKENTEVTRNSVKEARIALETTKLGVVNAQGQTLSSETEKINEKYNKLIDEAKSDAHRKIFTEAKDAVLEELSSVEDAIKELKSAAEARLEAVMTEVLPLPEELSVEAAKALKNVRIAEDRLSHAREKLLSDNTVKNISDVKGKLMGLERNLLEECTANPDKAPEIEKRVIEIRAERAVLNAEKTVMDGNNKAKGANEAVELAREVLKKAQADLTGLDSPENKIKVVEAEMDLAAKESTLLTEQANLGESISSKLSVARDKLVTDLTSTPEELAETSKSASESIAKASEKFTGSATEANRKAQKLIETNVVRQGLIELYKGQLADSPALTMEEANANEAALKEQLVKLEAELKSTSEPIPELEKPKADPTVDPAPEPEKLKKSDPAPEPEPKSEKAPEPESPKASEPPVEKAGEAPKDFIESAKKLDAILAEEQVRLSSQESLTAADQNKLSENIAQRARLVANAKSILEGKINKVGATPQEILEAKKALYETWGDRIESSLEGAEKTKFASERLNFDVDTKIGNTEFKSQEFKTAEAGLKAAKDVLEKAGNAATEAQRAELKAREAQVKSAKIQEVLTGEGISEASRAELQSRGIKHLTEVRRALGNLETKLSEEIKATTDAEAKKNLENKQVEVKAEQIKIASEKVGAVLEVMSPEAQEVSKAYKDALEKVAETKAEFERSKTPQAELEYRKAQHDAHGKDIARAEYEVKVNRAMMDRNNAGAEELKKNYEQVSKQAVKDIEVENRILEKTIEDVNKGKAIIEQQQNLAKAQAEYIEAKLKHSAGETGAKSAKDLNTQAKAVRALEVKVGSAVSAHQANIRAKTAVARLWVRTQTSFTPYQNGVFKHPLASLAAITAVHSALDGAVRADLHPEAAHSYYPRLLATLGSGFGTDWGQDARYFYLGQTFKTTAELGEHADGFAKSRRIEAVSHLADASIKFGATILPFEAVTRGIPALYNGVGRFAGVSATRGFVGTAAAGNGLMKYGVNPALAGYVAYEMGYGSTAGGQFMTGDKQVLGGLVTADHLDVGAPTLSSLIMGGSVAGIPGMIATGALQVAGTWRGIEVALNKLDKTSEAYLAQSAVLQAIQKATERGLFMPEQGKRELGATHIRARSEYTVAERDAMDLIVIDDLYYHFFPEEKAETKSFLGKQLELSKYSVQELEMLRMAADPTRVNLKDSQVKEYNYALVQDLFSKEKKYSGGKDGWDMQAMIPYLGSTALENIEDPALRAKLNKDIEALRDFYAHIYDHSLRTEISVTDGSTTHEQWDHEYGNQIQVFLTKWIPDSWGGGVADTSGDNTGGRLNSKSVITHLTRRYAQFLTGNANFQNDITSKISPDRAKNMLEIFENLPKYYPGLPQILQSPNGFSNLRSSFLIESLEGDVSTIAEKDRYHKFGSSIVEFIDYAKSLTNDPAFNSFVSDIKDPSKGMYNSDGTFDARFEQYLPGITKLLSPETEEVGIKILENVLGEQLGYQHPLLLAVKEAIANYEQSYPTIDLNDFREVFQGSPQNGEKLQKLVEMNAFTALDGYCLIKNNSGENSFDTSRDLARSLIDPCGIKQPDGKSWVFLRTIKDEGVEVPVIMNVTRDSFAKSEDLIVKLARDVYMSCTKEGRIVFNETIPMNEKVGNLELISGQVRSDGSIFMTVKEGPDSPQKSYIISPWMNKGKFEWREKKEAHLEGNKVVLGRPS